MSYVLLVYKGSEMLLRSPKAELTLSYLRGEPVDQKGKRVFLFPIPLQKCRVEIRRKTCIIERESGSVESELFPLTGVDTGKIQKIHKTQR